MKNYTSHDVVVILKKLTLLKFLKDYNFSIKIYPVPEAMDKKKFLVIVDENQWFSRFSCKIDPKLEKIEFLDHDLMTDFVVKKKITPYTVVIKSNYIPES